jgi:hypothetical protein
MFEPFYEDFRCEYLIKRMISMLLITKKFQDRQKTKVVWDALETLMKCSRTFFENFCASNFLWWFKKNRIIKRMLCLLNAG